MFLFGFLFHPTLNNKQFEASSCCFCCFFFMQIKPREKSVFWEERVFPAVKRLQLSLLSEEATFAHQKERGLLPIYFHNEGHSLDWYLKPLSNLWMMKFALNLLRHFAKLSFIFSFHAVCMKRQEKLSVNDRSETPGETISYSSTRQGGERDTRVIVFPSKSFLPM